MPANVRVNLSKTCTLYHVTQSIEAFKKYFNFIMHVNLKHLNKIDVDSESYKLNL